MGMLRRRVPRHYVPIHPDNITTNDWVILLEAGTIIGPSAEKLRVAAATLEKKIVTKYNIFLRKSHFLVLERIPLKSKHSLHGERSSYIL